MKLNDIKNLTTEELITKEQELKAELFNLRFSHATGNLANPMQLHNLKKDIARVKQLSAKEKLKRLMGKE